MITTAKKIKIELIKKGISGAEIGRKLGVTRVAIYHVIEGRNRPPRIRKAIAKALGISVKLLWPGNNNSHKEVA